METSHARVATPHATRYLTQLCKHWSHRFAVEVGERQGRIDFGHAVCLLAADDAHLSIAITVTGTDLATMETVVADHVNRFAHREGALHYGWEHRDT